MARSPWRGRTWALAFLAWTLLALTYTAAMVGSARLRHQELTWAAALGYNLLCCYLWMLLSPLAIAAARWAGFEARQWARALAVHVPTFLLLALTQHLIFFWANWQLGSPLLKSRASLAEVLWLSLPWRMHDGLVIYGLLLLALYTLHHLQKGEVERAARRDAEARLATAQLQALRMQLQPHFLFNTLNAVSALVGEDPPRAKAMIAKLGAFLRLTLEDPEGSEVPLHQELRFLEGYLEIQRLRFQDRLSVRLDVAEDTLDLHLPHLLLQPLVENALQHGLARPGPATLSLRIRRDGERLLLEVEDDGLGLPERWREGVGLANTRARIQASRGAAAALELRPRPGGGVLARISLPLEAHA